MQVEVPIGCRATVYVPFQKDKTITENGKPIKSSDDLKVLGEKEDCQVLSINSGNYYFISK